MAPENLQRVVCVADFASRMASAGSKPWSASQPTSATSQPQRPVDGPRLCHPGAQVGIGPVAVQHRRQPLGGAHGEDGEVPGGVAPAGVAQVEHTHDLVGVVQAHVDRHAVTVQGHGPRLVRPRAHEPVRRRAHRVYDTPVQPRGAGARSPVVGQLAEPSGPAVAAGEPCQPGDGDPVQAPDDRAGGRPGPHRSVRRQPVASHALQHQNRRRSRGPGHEPRHGHARTCGRIQHPGLRVGTVRVHEALGHSRAAVRQHQLEHAPLVVVYQGVHHPHWPAEQRRQPVSGPLAQPHQALTLDQFVPGAYPARSLSARPG